MGLRSSSRGAAVQDRLAYSFKQGMVLASMGRKLLSWNSTSSTGRHMNRYFFAINACALLAWGGVAHAGPSIQSANFFTDTYGSSVSFSNLSGSYLQLSTVIVSSDLVPQVSAVATQGALVRDLNFFTGPIFAEKNYNRYLTNTSLTGAWNLVATDSTGSTNGTFAAIADPELLPFLLNLQVTPNGLTPSLSWGLPDLSSFDVDSVLVRAVVAATGEQVFQSSRFETGVSNFTLPGGVLLAGVGYEFRVMLEDFDGSRLENRSNTFSSVYAVTAAIPEPSTYALMLAGIGLVGFAIRRSRKAASHET